MASSILFTFILIWTLCVFEAEAHWLRRSDTFHQSQAWRSEELAAALSSSSSQSYIFSLPTPSVIEPAFTSQGMVVSSIVPLYEVCDTPGPDTTGCSDVFETIVTTTCSTVLTYAFTQATISDCSQNITFSTQSSYSLVTTTVSPTVTPAPWNQLPAVTTYVQSIVSFYIASWQALAANAPSNVTVLICEYDLSGESTCTTIQEIWVVSTVYIPVVTTGTLIISTTLASPAVLLLGPLESITATAGLLYISTEIVYSSMTPCATTSTSTILPTSTSVETLTITSTLPPRTITITLSSVSPAPEPTTTLFSTTVITSTVTVHPMPRV
ncbi:hypothetical protein N431DRAFT_408637 [Stipitochalara longipes BDJ]|nr:hypothetical protein N431DRAFT_408637 [Stipitochalara longipes BDJ]